MPSTWRRTHVPGRRASLRELKADENPVLFRINMEAGHAGASGRFSRLEEIAYGYAFALKVTHKA